MIENREKIALRVNIQKDTSPTSEDQENSQYLDMNNFVDSSSKGNLNVNINNINNVYIVLDDPQNDCPHNDSNQLLRSLSLI